VAEVVAADGVNFVLSLLIPIFYTSPIMKTTLLLASTLFLSAIPASAATTVTSATDATFTTTADSDWRYQFSLPGWLPSLNGHMIVKGEPLQLDLDVYDELLPNLSSTVMGSFEVGKGKWSFLTDLLYISLKPSGSLPRADFDMELQQFMGNFAVFYNVLDTEDSRMDVYGGVRVNWLKVDVDARGKGPLGRTFSKSSDMTWVDPIVGVRYQYDINEKTFITAMADVGGFGVASDFAGNALISLGYRVNDKLSLGVGYKANYSDYTDGDVTYDITEHGLLLSLDYAF
jgi:hypothetical protein